MHGRHHSIRPVFSDHPHYFNPLSSRPSAESAPDLTPTASMLAQASGSPQPKLDASSATLSWVILGLFGAQICFSQLYPQTENAI